MDPWFNKKFCNRCGKSLADGFSMSRFDTSALCFDCLEEERQHPDYQKAMDAELAALRSGNRNFEGIGRRQKREGKIMANTKTNITVQLTGTDGNIFCVIAKVREALRRNGRSDLIKEFTDYITSSSSYEEALCRVMEYVIVKEQTMRAVKIDPVSRTVTEINLKKNPNNTLDELYEIIGCDLVELVQIDRDMVMVVDEEGKCKSVHGAFTFIGSGMVIAGTAIILGGSGDRFKALPENLASFEMMTEWVEPKDVPPPRQTLIFTL